MFGLDLPEHAVPDRFSVVRRIEANKRKTYATLDGPGCIRHIYLTLSKPIAPNALAQMNRKIIIRIYFDDSAVPQVEAPAGDFFGALHPPESHMWVGMPYYTHEDTGEARVAQRLVGYRFFVPDPIRWRESVHMRFGTMENDVCATVYWYQSGPRRPFVKLPKFEALLPGVELKRGEMDLPLPDHGSWWLNGPIPNTDDSVIKAALKNPLDAKFKAGGEGWVKQRSEHGFTDFNHAYRPHQRGVGIHYRGQAAQAGCVLEADRDMTAQFQITWDDHLVLRVNQEQPIDLGSHEHFRTAKVSVPLKKGSNCVLLLLSNEQGSNHGGWAFAFKATTPEGKVLVPRAVD